MVERSKSCCSLKNPAGVHHPSQSLTYISGILCVLFNRRGSRIAMLPRYLLIKQCILWEYRELSGTVKLPSQIATWLSPKGSEKKQSLYSKQPSACKTNAGTVEGWGQAIYTIKQHQQETNCILATAAFWNSLLMSQADMESSSKKAFFPTGLYVT